MSLTIKGLNRFALWLLLVVLTATILVFPTHLTLEYTSIQSTRIFSNLPFFAILFCVWLAVLFFLLFSRSGKGEHDWEKLALVCIFSAVFLGFWTIITHKGLYDEGIYNAAHVKYMNEVGKIPLGNKVLGYYDFPGLHLIGSFVSQITGLDVISAVSAIVFFQALLLTALLYVLFKRWLNDHPVAPLATLLVIQGNISLDKLNFFHPRNLGVIMIVMFLVLVSRNKGKLFTTLPDAALMLIVAAATTMVHCVSSFVLFSIVVGIYIMQRWHREQSENVASLIFFIFLPLAWAMYWAIITFQGILATFPEVFSEFTKGNGLWFLKMMAQANVGGSTPLWASVDRLFWWVLIYGLGSFIGLWNLFRYNKLSAVGKMMTGVFLGIILISAVSTLASAGGSRFDTYILYGAFAAVPLLLWFLLQLGDHIRNYALVCLVILFFGLSFPTFLSNNNMVELDAYYPDEHAYSRFLESNFGAGENLSIYGSSFQLLLISYYTPDANFTGMHPVLEMQNVAGLWTDAAWINSVFQAQVGQTRQDVIFTLSKRLMLPYEEYFGVTLDNPLWQKLRDNLSAQNLIYDNQDVEIFMHIQGGS